MRGFSKRAKQGVRVRRWPTGRTLDRLRAEASNSFEPVTKLIEDRAVPVPDRESGKVGWGQYLDELHKSKRQWGRYGTSAAVRALACAHRAMAPGEPLAQVEVLTRLHPNLLPEEVPEDDAALKTGDFGRVVKLAYILEGVRPQEKQIPKGSEPPIVSHLVGLRHDGQWGWSSRDGQDSFRDRLLPTALVLHALRRFPGAQGDEHVRDAYVRLAKAMSKEGVQIDLAALTGIALVEASDAIRGMQEVKDGLTVLDEKLSAWAAGQKRPAIDRPYFNGFVEHDQASGRDSTDYVFLSPELLATRYFLQRDVPKTRRFVLCVVAALVNDIKDNTANDMGGYAIQGTMTRTVDQAWAMDLLETFEDALEEAPRKLLPQRTAWLTSFVALIGMWAVLIVGITVWLIATGQPLLPVIMAVAAILFTLAMRRGKG